MTSDSAGAFLCQNLSSDEGRTIQTIAVIDGKHLSTIDCYFYTYLRLNKLKVGAAKAQWIHLCCSYCSVF